MATVIKKLALTVAAVVAVMGAIYALPSVMPDTSGPAGEDVALPVTSASVPQASAPQSPVVAVTVPGLISPVRNTTAPGASKLSSSSVNSTRPKATSTGSAGSGPGSVARHVTVAASPSPARATPSTSSTGPYAAKTTTAPTTGAGVGVLRKQVPKITATIAVAPVTPRRAPVSAKPEPQAKAPVAPKRVVQKPAVTKPAVPKPAVPKPVTRRPAPRPAPAPNFGIPVTVGNATQMIVVTAPSSSSTTGTLAAWQKQANGTWTRQFGPVIAHLGSEGVGTPSEDHSRTPRGTYGLTEAFGRNSDPGTSLPYSHVTNRDWWVSDRYSAKYNTHQICAASSCPFNTGAGENLYDAGPVYDYAVVMDVNRWPAISGGGSAYFLHVTDGGSTAGCVAINEATLLSIMRWLTPAAHPRIAIGVG